MSGSLSRGDNVTELDEVNVWLGLGSNMEPEKHVPEAVCDLATIFGELRVSPVYESEAVGFLGDNFFNLVVGIRTRSSLRDLVTQLRQVEERHGRQRSNEKFLSRTLDIDLLTYGDQVVNDGSIQLPRDEILRFAFVLLPLSDVAGNEVHPTTGFTYNQLRAAFNKQDQSLWQVVGGLG
ncbi:MAG: 2-amino-4-hydroxy-6-hydroxymethyldihydropteridine diphosphokinase [Candidatus Thiodiazotropha sp. (ex Lucinoma aequizonata)]|nr:2-amino-4-hydroxy-6-hydroxymethyldihydropteridine diphosphokinase [Candidatus Thiodiazotropha sp. (ex Lucinoma aequizonata)]MCU7887184.1 2-amino-4-hydroxy-6-hydroxymethyldihydropteridine diphosphokinase [Candidatus Thiodiazotropha sp. (ex Lucinoma aequizonata)]MCU7895718.1 2-amino-4-hydroxy-6-hydroxymethyldihydropteridine diphosphokinase [Candidatus Thiodiazotropha sp. (ex Lucinoma aequizonata)]MCU7898199.1 2-amino-4-hydroxy-6-hydroxymethyldihydropteridine diphosphokinase [Candidatus Thiodiaz